MAPAAPHDRCAGGTGRGVSAQSLSVKKGPSSLTASATSASSPSIALSVYIAQPASPTAERLQLLAALTLTAIPTRA